MLSLKIFDERVGDFGAGIVDDPRRRALHLLHQPAQVVLGMRDADHAHCCPVPQLRAIQLRHRDIETGAQLVFQAAHNLPPVFQRLRGFDVKFECKKDDHVSSKGFNACESPGSERPGLGTSAATGAHTAPRRSQTILRRSSRRFPWHSFRRRPENYALSSAATRSTEKASITSPTFTSP